MTKPNQPTIVGRGLAGELRELRQSQKLSVRAVAAQLDWQPSKLSRMETGQQGIRVEDVASLLVIYRVTGEDRRRLLGMAERSGELNWWEVLGGLSTESKTLIQLEAEATAIFDFEPLLIPGLLQTADYTRALMKCGGVADADAQSRVAARLGRQAILTKDEPPRLHAVIDEGVLHRVLSSRTVQARQLRHLTEMATRPGVTLQVIPQSVGGHNGLDGSFALLDFPRNSSVAYLDHKISGLFLEQPDQVTLFRREADSLTRVALNPADSIELVASVATVHERVRPTMIAAELPEMVWRKSSRSGTNANCVEVAETPTALAVRDSKDPDGSVLLFPRASWTTFLTALHAGEFDR